MLEEIGSEFWINYRSFEYKDLLVGTPNWIKKFGNTVLTSSGRGAISLMLKEINNIVPKTALLPSYICESVILPFIQQGYKCFFII